MNDKTLGDVAASGRNIPLRSGGFGQHDARHRAHSAETFPFRGSSAAAAGHLHAVNCVVITWVNRRGFDFDS